MVRDEKIGGDSCLGNVTLQARTGAVKLQGPVGTVNPNLQSLSPAGFDHNYRAWWVDASSEKAVLDFNFLHGATIVNPTFRFSNMHAGPKSVALNVRSLNVNKDYFVV